MSRAMNLRIAKARIAKKKRDREMRMNFLRYEMEIARIRALLDCRHEPAVRFVST